MSCWIQISKAACFGWPATIEDWAVTWEAFAAFGTIGATAAAVYYGTKGMREQRLEKIARAQAQTEQILVSSTPDVEVMLNSDTGTAEIGPDGREYLRFSLNTISPYLTKLSVQNFSEFSITNVIVARSESGGELRQIGLPAGGIIRPNDPFVSTAEEPVLNHDVAYYLLYRDAGGRYWMRNFSNQDVYMRIHPFTVEPVIDETSFVADQSEHGSENHIEKRTYAWRIIWDIYNDKH